MRFFCGLVYFLYFCRLKSKDKGLMKKWLCILLLALTGINLSISASESMIKTLRTRYIDVRTMEPIGGNPVRPFLVKAVGRDIDAEGDLNKHLLEISFDELSHEVHQYTYTLVHLNADGKVSGLSSYEYVGGFTTKDITDYESSLNTSQLYTHYSFVFPNEEMTIKASGLYALRIYEDGDPEKVVAEVRFAVVEPSANIQARVRANTDIEINRRYQQVDIDIQLDKQANKTANGDDYFIVVRQNGRSDNQAFAPKPTFIEANKLHYTHCKELIFEGGNEYHHFDTYSTYFAGVGVDRIVHDRNDFHAILFAEPFQANSNYMHEYDVDGQWVVNAERTLYDMDTEAEYMWVHWTVPAAQPWFDGVVYVGGDLFDNKLSPNNRMQYDNTRKCYWLNALVKQGGYDYQYWFFPTEDKKVTLQRTEGSHWETENEYTIYVYYRPFGSRADQLVGLQVIH